MRLHSESLGGLLHLTTSQFGLWPTADVPFYRHESRASPSFGIRNPKPEPRGCTDGLTLCYCETTGALPLARYFENFSRIGNIW